MTETSSAPLLELKDLAVHYPGKIKERPIRAVDGVNLELHVGETLGLVGESGCGKSTTARAIIGLVKPAAGSVYMEGNDVTKLHGRKRKAFLRKLQMVFQDPYASLDPRQTVGEILAEPIEIHHLSRGKNKKLRTIELMLQVGLDPTFLNRYPHEFSGGQRQRIGIARALALEPKVLLLDEPVSALDVSIQAQVLNLLSELKADLGLSYLFIAHDLAVVRHLSDRVAVMYLGRIAEIGTREQIFGGALHPYTKALLSAVPIPDPVAERKREHIVLKGDPPSPDRLPVGCAFASRCPIVRQKCHSEEPELEVKGGGQMVACWEVD